MALKNTLLLTQVAGYCVALILALCIVVPMSLHSEEFNGNCLLFSQGNWNNTAKWLDVSWASTISCHYVLFVGVAVMVTCLVQLCLLLLRWVEGRNSSFLSMFLEVAGCMVLSVLSVSAGIITTVGYMNWCQSVSKQFPSCEDLAGETIHGDNEITSWFYIQMEVAQVGVWGAFATLVGLGVGGTVALLLRHQACNLHAAAREPEEARPLLNSGWPEEGRSTQPPQNT